MDKKIKIREIKEGEISQLQHFLYEAIYIPAGREKPERSIIELPELACYIRDFGKDTDHCLVAESDGVIKGAVWARVFNETEKGFGYVDPFTPELSMSVLPDSRNQGIGTMLLKAMIQRLAEKGFEKVSLSVDTENYACSMYKKLGFETVKMVGESETMILSLNNSTQEE
jgi:ribosomal protein S18 acetylase RimI-like enzyme